MKRIAYLISFTLLTSIIISSCSSTPTYAELRQSEKTLIADYISRKNINIIPNVPANNVWGKNDYVLTPKGMYFHLESRGVGSDSLELSNTVVPRYKQYTLNEVSDTISYWSTTDYAYTTNFVFGTSSLPCVAFQEAASFMKRNESVAEIIVPSVIGFNENMLTVTPLGYHLRIQILK